MSYKILIVEKARDEIPSGKEWDNHYFNLNSLMEMGRDFLVEEGH